MLVEVGDAEQDGEAGDLARDLAQKGGLAGAGGAFDDQLLDLERLLQQDRFAFAERDRGRRFWFRGRTQQLVEPLPDQPAQRGCRALQAGLLLLPLGDGPGLQRDVQFVDGKRVRLAGTDLESAEFDRRAVLAEPGEVGRSVAVVGPAERALHFDREFGGGGERPLHAARFEPCLEGFESFHFGLHLCAELRGECSVLERLRRVEAVVIFLGPTLEGLIHQEGVDGLVAFLRVSALDLSELCVSPLGLSP